MPRMNKNTSTAPQRVFLWLCALTLLIIAGGVVYTLTRGEAPGGAVPELRADDHVRGNREATTVLIEYSDFQCPACAAFHLLLKDIESQYASSTAIVYRHFPLDQHKNARLAATAAEAAGMQGKFFEMHDLIFDHQKDWVELSADAANDYFVKLAEQLNIETARFSDDMRNPSIKERIDRDEKEGTAGRVSATPTFYLNGKQLKLTSYADLTAKVLEAHNATSTL